MRKTEKNYEAAYRKLKLELMDLDYFCKGTISKYMNKCGKKTCPCHRDVKKLHGPYWQWTFKKEGKTNTKLLKGEKLKLYQNAISQNQKLNKILKKMEVLSLQAIFLEIQKNEK